MQLKPIGDKVVVEVIDEPQTTASGIVLPDSAKEKSQRGKVVAVGSGKLLDNGERIALEVKVGDTIVFAKYGGTEIDLDGKDLMILSERDIHAIVE
ncbi:MAG: co-chaperone GroES [Trueperaceae bacterium]|jgi:chaperonin GroES|nr:co-chaperone GroES [Trueperaceae bacterium]